jgi:hypothetical protein
MPKVRKLALAPPDELEWLHKAFVEHGFGDIEAITARFNERLAKLGVPLRLGKSAIGEESQRVRRAQEAIAATTKQMQLIANTARDDADLRGEALNAMVSHSMFEALLLAQESEAAVEPADRIALLGKAALAAGRLTTTSVRQRKFRHEVDQRTKAAADAVTKIAKTGGLSAAHVREIRSQILGISNVTKAPPAAEPATTPAT